MFTSILSTAFFMVQMSSHSSPDCDLRFTCEDGAPFAAVMADSFGEIQNQIQFLRELAIQASNGALGSTDRGYLQDEAEARLDEIQRLLSQTRYRDLFGELHEPFNTGLDFLLAYSSNLSKIKLVSKFHFPKLNLSNLGGLASFPAHIAEPNRLSKGPLLRLNEVDIARPSRNDDTVSTLEGWNSAIAWAASINKYSVKSRVHAKTLETIVALPLDFSQFPITGAQIKINHETILQGYAPLASANDLIELINDFSSSTGVKARYTPFNISQIELYATDGRNIVLDLLKQKKLEALFSNTIPADQPSVHFGEIELRSAAAFKIEDVGGVFTNPDLKSAVVDVSTHLSDLDLTTQEGAQDGLALLDSAFSSLVSVVMEINRLYLYCPR